MKEFEYPIDAASIMQKKRALKKELLKQDNLIEKRIAILSGSTIGEIKNILELFLLNNGIKPTFYVGEYSLFYENLVFDDGSLRNFSPDIIYIHTSNKNLKNMPVAADDETAFSQKLEQEYSYFESAWKAALSFNCPVIQNNFELPSYRVLGNSDCWRNGKVCYINEINSRMASFAAANNDFYIQDINYLSARFGLDNWYSESCWYLYKYSLNTEYIPYLCENLSFIIKSIFGKNKKSVILDLDNTLWGGVIGDDGVDGIQIGMETPEGMAYTEFQNYLKELASIGVILNVASKNEESIALEGIESPRCPLSRKDFLCFKANWQAKHENIAQMAKEINILPDSFVFIDDNPAERDIVKTNLPAVTVPPVEGPESYISYIDRAGYFEVTSLSQDDKKRNEMYRQNIQRLEEQQSFTDYKQYLKSLDMTAVFGKFDMPHAERITQLINKTNQFNLTTRRYTPAEVEALISNPDYITLYASLADKFGDNGLVTALIGEIKPDNDLYIDLWIMSCRTFKRELEYAMADELVCRAKEKGVKRIYGVYYPTAKNLLVADFYATIGFKLLSANENERRFALDIDDYKPLNTVIKTQTDK